jgi:WD40 repeat protein
VNIKSPYRGLAAFDDSELDALYFFGRERDTEIVVANLIASRFTVLYGPSGVGKSSLLLAAVARTLRELPEEPVVVVFSSWSDHPEHGLAAALAGTAGIEGGELLGVAERAQATRDVYLILDQAEEYFTYHGDAGGFERALAELVNRPLRVNVLLSLREDTLARLDRLKGRIPNLFGNVLRLDRLDRAAGRAAIVRPLERWGELEGEEVDAEDVLVERVLDGVGTGRIELGPGGLGMVEQNGSPRGIEAPYLQLVMQRLWDIERGAGSATLRAETLDSLGGAGQIVADHLERAIDALTPDQREIAARIFDHLVTPSGTKIAHEASDLAEFAGASEEEIRPVIATLANHRILRTDESGRWEIFHDVLAGAVLGWKSRHDAERAVERARQEARRRHRRLAFLAFGALVGLTLATGLAVFALSQRSEARDQARVARGGQLVASSLSLLDSDPEAGLALALEAASIDPTPRAEDSLRQALAASRERGVIDVGHPLVGLELDRSGSRALVVGADGRARLIDLGTLDEVWAHRVDGAAAAFAPDGRTVHVVDRRSLIVLDADTGKAVGEPVRLSVPGDVERLVVSPQGTSAIVVVGKPRARVVALATGAALGRVKQPPQVADAAWAPSGRVVASAGADRTARLWDTRTWTETRALRGHVGRVLVVSFDRTGERVGTGSTDQTARVWRAATGALVTPLYGHTGKVSDVSFGANGEVVTASGDGTARTWGPNGRPFQILRGHRGAVVAAAYAKPDVVVSAGSDGTVRLWDPGTSIGLQRAAVEGPPPPGKRAASHAGDVVATATGSVVRLRSPQGTRVLRGHKDLVNTVAFSPDDQLLVTAGRDHDVIVWDVASGELVHRFPEAQSASVADARFSPDGRWIVTAGPISARLWSVADWRPLTYLYGPKSPVNLTAVGFEPDSRTVITREEDGTVRRYVCQLCGGIDELSALARSRLEATNRKLTAAERADYLG